VLAIAVWALAPAAGAASPRSNQADADILRAQALFDRGRQLMTQGRASEACPLFEESQRLDAGIGTQYNLAACYEALGRVASAYALFLEVSATAQARGQTERARAAAMRARSVEPKLSRLVIETESEQRSALIVERDGNVVDPTEQGIAVPVDPGRHEVRAHGTGLVPWARVIEVDASPVVHRVRIPALPLAPTVVAELPAAGLPTAPAASCDPATSGGCAAPEAPPAESSLRPALGITALGVGVAGLGLGTGLALHARAKNESSEAAGCDAHGCPTSASLALRKEAIKAGNWATVSAGIGLAGVAAGGILLWALPHSDRADAAALRVLPNVTLESAGLDVSGRF
jgi:hypothetical protein